MIMQCVGLTICDKVCRNGGQCIDGNLCSCTSEWTGITCETRMLIYVMKDIACNSRSLVPICLF